MDVNKKIKQYLKEHGITQAFLERKTGIPHDILSKILSGKRKLSAQELGVISSALGVKADIFLT